MVRTGPSWSGPVPSRVVGGAAHGHFMNDGALVSDTWTGVEGLMAAINAYEDQTGVRRNVVYDPNGRWRVLAARDLEPGEELFNTYGAGYWVDRLSSMAGKPEQRLLAYFWKVGGGSRMWRRLPTHSDMSGDLSTSHAFATCLPHPPRRRTTQRPSRKASWTSMRRWSPSCRTRARSRTRGGAAGSWWTTSR
jgi:hypothetical protein